MNNKSFLWFICGLQKHSISQNQNKPVTYMMIFNLKKKKKPTHYFLQERNIFDSILICVRFF